MKIVSVPGPVSVKTPRRNGEGVEFVSHDRDICYFLIACIESYEPFSTGHVNAILYKKLRDVISESSGKSEIWFEDSDFKSLQAAVAAVGWRTPDINMAYIPFYEAVASAKTQVVSGPGK